MATAVLFQQVFHVLEKLHVTALVRGNGNTLHVFLNSAFYYLCHTAVMTQVNNLCSLALENAAHNIDRCIVPVEKRGRRNDTDFVLYLIAHIVLNRWAKLR